MTSSIDLHEMLEESINDSVVEGLVKGYWPNDAVRNRFPAATESEAVPGQPYPRIIYRIAEMPGAVRMSRKGRSKFEFRSFTVVFEIYAKQVPGKSAKDVAVEILRELTVLYGGHPVQGPTVQVSSEYSCLVDIRYISDVGLRLDENLYMNTLTYEFKLDSQIRVMP